MRPQAVCLKSKKSSINQSNRLMITSRAIRMTSKINRKRIRPPEKKLSASRIQEKEPRRIRTR